MTSMILAALGRLATLVRLWLRHEQTKHRLAQLDERMLKDVGISTLDALIEADRPFWRQRDARR